jgi:SAM-dependent methyltransferase
MFNRWLFPFRSIVDAPPPPCELTRHELRRLLMNRQLRPGSRVLDAGCGEGELIRFLRHLGLEADGFDERSNGLPETIGARIASGEPLLFPAHSYQLVLARQLTEYQENLLGGAALAATARLLALVRPGGWLIMTFRARVTQGAGHSAACYQSHLTRFALDVRTTRLGTGWSWPFGTTRAVPLSIAESRIPEPARPAAEWLDRAGAFSAEAPTECCRATGQPQRLPQDVRRAA